VTVETFVGTGEDDEEITVDALLFTVVELEDSAEPVSIGVSSAATELVPALAGVNSPVIALPLTPSSLV